MWPLISKLQTLGVHLGGTQVHIPRFKEVGVPESNDHVTPHFEAPDLRGPSRGYPGPHTQIQRSWLTRVQRSCDPLIRWAGLRESIGGIPESKITNPKKLPCPSPKIHFGTILPLFVQSAYMSYQNGVVSLTLCNGMGTTALIRPGKKVKNIFLYHLLQVYPSLKFRVQRSCHTYICIYILSRVSGVGSPTNRNLKSKEVGIHIYIYMTIFGHIRHKIQYTFPTWKKNPWYIN